MKKSLAQMAAGTINEWADSLAKKVDQLEAQKEKRTNGLVVAVELLQEARPYIKAAYDDAEARHDNEVMQKTEHIIGGIATLERIFQEVLNE